MEPNSPEVRTFASLFFDPDHSRHALIAGQVQYCSEFTKGSYGLVGSKEVWEMDPMNATFTDRSTDYQMPSARAQHARAYRPRAWTHRSPADSSLLPAGRNHPVVSFDGGMGKLIVWDGSRVSTDGSQSNGSFRAWDVVSRRWIHIQSSAVCWPFHLGTIGRRLSLVELAVISIVGRGFEEPASRCQHAVPRLFGGWVGGVAVVASIEGALGQFGGSWPVFAREAGQ